MADFGPQLSPYGNSGGYAGPIVNVRPGNVFGGTELNSANIIQGLGGVLGGVGSMISSQGFAKYNAANARAARALAAEAPKVAAWQRARLRLQKRRTLSSQRFAAAASGVQLEGTTADIIRLTEQEFLLDEQQIWREGQISKITYEEQASAYDAAAKANKKAGFMSAIQTGIGVARIFL